MSLELKLIDAASRLYTGSGNAPGIPLSLYYLLTGDGATPGTLPFDEAWRQRSGAYALVPTATPVTDPAAFAAALGNLLEPRVPQSQWIAWVPSPQPVGGALADVRLITISKPVGEDEGSVIAGGATLGFGNLALVVQPETLASADLSAASPGLTLTNKQDIGSTMTLRQSGTSRALDLPAGTLLTIPLTGERLGAWTFPLDVNRGSFYELFDVPESFAASPSAEVRYTWLAGGAPQELRYPVLLGALANPNNPPQARLPLQAAIDPLAPTSFTRTRFVLDLAAYVPGGPVLPQSIALRTTAGHEILLTPLAGSGYGLARRVGTARASLYLAPAGPFEARTNPVPGAALAAGPIANGAMLVMCGLTGTEFLLAAEEDRLEFMGEEAANATGFPGIAGRPVLDGAYSTGWIKLLPGPLSGQTFPGPIKQSYCAQATDAVYFHRGGATPFPLAVGARLGDLSDPSRSRSFPMAAYGWVFFSDPEQEILNPNPTAPGTLVTSYENQVLAPARRDAIAVDRCLGPLLFDLGTLTPLAGGWVQTANGLLVELNDGGDPKRPAGTWASLVLARGPVIPDQWLRFLASTQPSGCPPGQGPYEVVSPFLSTALTASAPFLVVTLPEPLGRYEKLMRLGEFTFRMDVAGGGTDAGLGTNSALVWKLDPRRSFADLAADVGAWTDSATFVGDAQQVAKISAQIQQFIAEARAASEEARQTGAFDYFRGFLERVDSPTWTGVLALNPPLDAQSLPLDLKALLGGIRPPQTLRGHHFGVNLNQLRQDAQASAAGQPPIEKSSLFGLVHFAQAFLPPATDFGFQLMRLNALFENSLLERFESRIAFTIKKLFGDPSRLLVPGTNDLPDTIVIDGALQEQDGQTLVVFATTELRAFDLPVQGNAFRAVSRMIVQGAALQTIGEEPQGASTIVESAFVLNGRLGFNTQPAPSGQPPIDLFSFGVEDDDPSTGLGYSSYGFAMTTTVTGDQGTLAPIQVDLAGLQLDIADSVAREFSLFSTLPMKLVRFRLDPSAGVAGTRQVTGTGLDPVAPQFAMELQLVMGTLGALSTQTPLEGALLLGWRAGGSASQPDRVGMLFVPPQQMAGTGGFKLQGVITTVYSDVELQRAELTSEETGEKVYVFALVLDPVDFSLFGLPLVPPAAVRSLTFFGDFETIGSPQGTNLAWFVGAPDIVAGSSSAIADEDPATTAMTRLARREAARASMLAAAADSEAVLIFTPVIGVVAGLRPEVDPLATLVVTETIEILNLIPVSTQVTLNDIYNGAELPVNYDPAAGVTAWIEIFFLNVTFEAVFSDPAIYGARIEVDAGEGAKGLLKSLDGFDAEIAYRKISDELGAWSASLTLPDRFRTIEFSEAVKLFLPTVGVVIYTNGDWRVEVGWPFSPFFAARLEFVVSGIPFVAQVGFYLAKMRSADNPAVFGNDFALIWAFGVGLGFGLGKTLNKGPLFLSASVTAFVTFEGFLASKHGAMTQYGVDYYWFAGQLGVRVYAVGSVDFKIIRAEVELQALLSLGWAVETDHRTVLVLRASFAVGLSVTLIFVTISFYFETEFTIATLSFGDTSLPVADTYGPTPTAVPRLEARTRRLLARPPKELDPRLLRPLTMAVGRVAAAAAQVDLRVQLLLQVTALAAGQASAPQVVASLLVEIRPDDPQLDEFARLVQGVGNWLAQAYGEAPPLLAQLGRIQAAIEDGRFSADLVTCLSSTFRFVLSPATGTLATDHAAIFPMFPQLKLVYDGKDVPFDQPLVPASYPSQLSAYFNQLATNPAPVEVGLDAMATAGVPQSVAGVVFADFFDVLGKQLVGELTDLAEADPALTFEQALAALGPEGYANIAGAVSRYAQYGLRLPTPDSQPFGATLAALYQLTRQQVPLVQKEGAWVTAVTLAYGTIDVSSWITFQGGATSISETLSQDLVLTQRIDPTWLTTGGGFRQLEPIVSVDEVFYLGDVRTWTRADGAEVELRQLQNALQLQLDASGTLDATVYLMPGDPEADRAVAGLPTVAAAPVLFVTLQLRKVLSQSTGTPLSGVYQLAGTDQFTRAQIELLLADPTALAAATLNMLAPLGDSAYRSSVEDSSIVLAKTNLSTISQPPQLFKALLAAPAPPPPPDRARLADTESFLRLVWELSIVHSGGFFLYMSDLPEEAFENGVAEIALLVTFGQPAARPRLARWHNMLQLATVPPQSTIGVTAASSTGTLRTYRQNYAGGSVGFEIVWPAPPAEAGLGEHPTPEQKAKFLEALYSILQYRVEAVQASTEVLLRATAAVAETLPSNWSLPIGQQDTGDWGYRQTLAVARFLGQPNRYAGVGLQVRFGVKLNDLFGNDLPALHPVPLTVVYNDPLVSVAEWTGTESTYVFTAGAGNQAVLHAVLRFRPQPLGGAAVIDVESARDALARYRLASDQLADPNASAAVCTVLAAQCITVDSGGQSLKARLLAYVDGDVIPWLEKVIGGQVPRLPPPVEILMTLPRAHVTTLPDDIFELGVALEIRRDPAKVEPTIQKLLPSVQRVASPLAPAPLTALGGGGTGTDAGDTLRAFTESFERAWAGFDGGTGLLKLAEGALPQTQSSAASDRQLWAVRWGDGAGLWARFPNADPQPGVADLPVYFSPIPLSTRLLNGTFDVRVYKEPWTGGGGDVEADVARTFSDVDLDLWGRAFVDSFEQVLMPEMATAIATLDGTRYSALIASKEALAGSIQEGLESVLSVPGQPVDPAAARERFRQALLQSLANNYALSSVVQLPARVTAARKVEPPVPPALYGDVIAPQVDDSHAFSLSPAKLPTREGIVQTPWLVSTKDPAAQAFLDLDLALDVGFVEHDFDPQRAYYGYVPSSWITFITPLFSPTGGPAPLRRPLGRNQIPIPLRAYPGAPALPAQQAVVPPPPVPTTIDEALRWTYAFTVIGSQSAQDRLFLDVILNQPPREVPVATPAALRTAAVTGDQDPARPAPRDLFEALARFIFEFPQIAPYLAKVPQAAFAGRDVAVALKALERFAGLVDGIETTWATWYHQATPKAFLAAGGNPNLPQETWSYVVDFQRRPDLLVTRTIQGSASLPPWPVIAGYQTPTDPGPQALYRRLVQTPGDAPLAGQLAVSLPGLFLLTRQSARTTARLDRNANLVPSGAPAGTTVNPKFVYDTPLVELPDPVVPLEQVPNPILMPQTPTLTQALDALFAPFVSGGDPSLQVKELRFSLDIFYNYVVATGTADQVLISSTPSFLVREDVSTPANSSGTPARTLAQVKQELAAALTGWYEALRPTDRGARLSFAFTAFSIMGGTSGEHQLPLARFRSIEVPVPPGDPAWWNG